MKEGTSLKVLWGRNSTATTLCLKVATVDEMDHFERHNMPKFTQE